MRIQIFFSIDRCLIIFIAPYEWIYMNVHIDIWIGTKQYNVLSFLDFFMAYFA